MIGNTMNRPIIALVLLLLVLPARAADDAKGYCVDLIRPAVAPDTRRLVLSYTRGVEMMITGTARAREAHVNQSVQLTAVVQMLAVSEYGVPRQMRLTVEKGSLDDGTGFSETLERGQVIDIEWKKSDGFVITRQKRELDRKATELLSEALPFGRFRLWDGRSRSLFDVSGSHRTGETWPVSPDALGVLTPRSIRLDTSRLEGSMTLAGAVRFRGEPCLKLGVKIHLPPGAPGTGVTPRNARFTDGSLDGEYLIYVPIQPGRPWPKWVENIRGTATAQPDQGAGGSSAQATAATSINRTIEFADVSGQ
jgi:hypothetical protein